MNALHAIPFVPFALFEDNLGESAHGVLLRDYLCTLDCNEADEADTFFAALEQHSHDGRWIALIAHYELGHAFESRMPASTSDAPLARALIFAGAVALDAVALTGWWQTRLAALTAQEREAGLLHLSAGLSKEDYAVKAQRVLDYIGAGDCYQVNLSFPMTGQYFGHSAGAPRAAICAKRW